MSETQMNQSTRAQQGAFSVLLRACSAVALPQCTSRVAHFVTAIIAFAFTVACSGNSKDASGSGGSSAGGESNQSSGGQSVAGNGGSQTISSSGSSTAGGSTPTTACRPVASACNNDSDCCQPYPVTCQVGVCTVLAPTMATGGRSSTGGASSTGGRNSTGGATAAGGAASICGNGIIELGETCDPPSSCPTACPGENACNVAERIGGAATCNLFCGSVSVVTVCKSGDSCCALGCTYANDTDCPNTGSGSCSRFSAIDVVNSTSGGCNGIDQGVYLWGWSCPLNVTPSTQGLSCVFANQTASGASYCCVSK